MTATYPPTPEPSPVRRFFPKEPGPIGAAAASPGNEFVLGLAFFGGRFHEAGYPAHEGCQVREEPLPRTEVDEAGSPHLFSHLPECALRKAFTCEVVQGPDPLVGGVAYGLEDPEQRLPLLDAAFIRDQDIR